MNGERALVGQTGANAVSTFGVLTPYGSRPKPPFVECVVIRDSTAAFDRYAFAIGKQHAAADATDGQIKPV